MRHRLKSVSILLSIVLVSLSCQREKSYTLEITDGTRIVHNLKPRIDNPRSSLEFILQIGELEPKDENYMFNQPLSVTEDHKGNTFVLDPEEGCIKKFSSSGEYLTQFGRKGQGPGEYQYPMQIDCRSDQLLVTSMAAQFHIFDLNGEYIKKFGLPQYQGMGMKLMDFDKVVGYSMGPRHDNTKENKILKIFDTEGNIEHVFGEPFLLDNARRSWSANFTDKTVDGDNNIYLAFNHQNRIEKYSDNGELLLKISRELPFGLEYKYRKENIEIQGIVREVDRDMFSLVSRGIGVDSQGRIWVLGLKAEVPWDQGSEDFVIQEYFHFEVFSKEGILLARLPFPDGMERFDNMTMDGEHIYFVDPYGQACVYKYKAIWRD